MKKIKSVLIAVALFSGICAFALPSGIADCTLSQQYVLVGGQYIPVGTFGHDYFCDDSADICTYVLISGHYVVCRVGTYISINGTR